MNRRPAVWLSVQCLAGVGEVSCVARRSGDALRSDEHAESPCRGSAARSGGDLVVCATFTFVAAMAPVVPFPWPITTVAGDWNPDPLIVKDVPPLYGPVFGMHAGDGGRIRVVRPGARGGCPPRRGDEEVERPRRGICLAGGGA